MSGMNRQEANKMASIEEIKNKAMTEYAANELNNIIESVYDEENDVATSKSYCNSIHIYMSGDAKILALNGYITVYIRNPVARWNSSNDIIIRAEGISDCNKGAFIIVPTEQVLKWLAELSE